MGSVVSGSIVFGVPGRRTYEIIGFPKKFSPTDGWGFIAAEDGKGDVFFDKACIERSRLKSGLSRQTRVICEVFDTPLGRRAHRLRLPSEPAAQVNDFEGAIVKFFNHAKGFGFLTRSEGTEDIFVHADVMEWSGIQGLETGQAVLVRWTRRAKGLVAYELKLPEAAEEG